MASISDMITQNALQNATQAPDLTGDIQKGAQLAQTVQNIQMQRQNLDIAKQDLEMRKWQRVGELSELGSKLEGPARSTFLNQIYPAALTSLTGGQIHPMNQDLLSKDPQVGAFLFDKAKQGDMSLTQIKGTLGDPEQATAVQASDEFKQWQAQKALKPTVDTSALYNSQTEEARNRLQTLLRKGTSNGGIDMSGIAAAKDDPVKMQQLLARTGIDKLGGLPVLSAALDQYQPTLSSAEKEGIQNDALFRSRALAYGPNGPMEQRNKIQVALQTQNQVNKDTTLNSFDQRAVGARRLTTLIDNALSSKNPADRVARTKQLMNAVAGEEAALISGKNNFAEGTAERAAYDNAQAQLGALKDKFSSLFTPEGTVTDAAGLTAQLKNAKVQANELGQSYVNELNDRLDTIATEQGALPEQVKIYEGKKAAFQKKYKDSFQGEKTYDIGRNGRTLTAAQIRALPPAAQALLPANVKQALGIK